MHGKKWIGVCLIALCGVSRNALADWKGKGELGASLASGNSENEAANAALEVKNTRDKWTHTLGLAGNYGSDGSVTTAERWEVRGQSDYAFTDRAYWFGAGRYEDDRFSAFEFQSSLSTGLGYKPLCRGTRDRRIGGRRDPAWRHGS
jgi:putative salt-induced outer membrane protein